jgi:hypothetical protein
MRTTSVPFRTAAYAQETAEVYVLLAEISHPDLAAPIYLSTDNADSFTVEGETVRGTTSGGTNYIYVPMRITWPDDSEETITAAKIEIDNVSSELLDEIRALEKRPTVVFKVVLASSPDVIEATTGNLQLQDVNADILTVTANLTRRNFFGEPYPGGSFTPSNFPGIF